MLKAGEITQEEYDRWRYKYPEFDTTQRWAKVPSQAFSDMLLEGLNDANNRVPGGEVLWIILLMSKKLFR